MSSRKIETRLMEVLRAERDCTEQLLEILLRERKLLSRTEPERLLQTAVLKKQFLEKLEALKAAHDDCLLNHHLPPGRAGTEQYLRRLAPDAPEHAIWAELRQLITRCKRQNLCNGDIIHLCHRQIGQALNILNRAGENGQVYSRTGEALAVKSSNSLATA